MHRFYRFYFYFLYIRDINFAIFFKLYSYYQLFNTSKTQASLITFQFSWKCQLSRETRNNAKDLIEEQKGDLPHCFNVGRIWLRKIKRKNWKTKGLIENSKIFRFALSKRFSLKHLPKKGWQKKALIIKQKQILSRIFYVT